MASKHSPKLVRLKSYNRKKGQLLRRFTYQGVRYDVDRGWYKVSSEVAQYLATVHQIPGDEDAPLAFDVVSESEAKAIDKRETEASRKASPAEAATDLTSSQFPSHQANDLSTQELAESTGSAFEGLT